MVYNQEIHSRYRHIWCSRKIQTLLFFLQYICTYHLFTAYSFLPTRVRYKILYISRNWSQWPDPAFTTPWKPRDIHLPVPFRKMQDPISICGSFLTEPSLYMVLYDNTKKSCNQSPMVSSRNLKWNLIIQLVKAARMIKRELSNFRNQSALSFTLSFRCWKLTIFTRSETVFIVVSSSFFLFFSSIFWVFTVSMPYFILMTFCLPCCDLDRDFLVRIHIL